MGLPAPSDERHRPDGRSDWLVEECVHGRSSRFLRPPDAPSRSARSIVVRTQTDRDAAGRLGQAAPLGVYAIWDGLSDWMGQFDAWPQLQARSTP